MRKERRNKDMGRVVAGGLSAFSRVPWGEYTFIQSMSRSLAIRTSRVHRATSS